MTPTFALRSAMVKATRLWSSTAAPGSGGTSATNARADSAVVSGRGGLQLAYERSTALGLKTGILRKCHLALSLALNKIIMPQGLNGAKCQVPSVGGPGGCFPVSIARIPVVSGGRTRFHRADEEETRFYV